jgi:hypothetical protein
MIAVILYVVGLLLTSVVFLLPMMFLAGISRVSLFHWLSRNRDMRMDPSRVIALNKQQVDIFFFCMGYVLLLGIYSSLFFL